MDCKICEHKTHHISDAVILKKYTISYNRCEHCGFVQTEDPYRLQESYADSINIEDIWLVHRNIHLSKMTALIIQLFYNKDAKYLDYAWWYGLFCRLMRDMWYDFYRDDIYTPNILAKWFAYHGHRKAELVTTFEVLEHLDKPLESIEKILSLGSAVLFSTELIPNPVPQPHDRWYYGLSHGQHISFFSLQTLEYIAKKYKLYLYTNWSNLHLFSRKKMFLHKWVFRLFRLCTKILPQRLYSHGSKLLSDIKHIQSLRP